MSKTASVLPTPEMLRFSKAAEIAGVSVAQIYALAAKGRIKSYKIEKSVRIDKADLLTYLASCARSGERA